MSDLAAPRVLEPINRPSVADSVFDELHRQILSLDLVQGAKLSEADVAHAVGVSRQPVRDAVYPFSKPGVLSIRPQRATTVSQISDEAVMQARFIRSAIEAETVRLACKVLTPSEMDALQSILDDQAKAVAAHEPLVFHRLDDLFHREICDRAGHGVASDIIRENKAHMDRVQFLSRAIARRDAFDDHLRIMGAIRARDGVAAAAAMRAHLARIKDQIGRIRAEHAACFETGAGIG